MTDSHTASATITGAAITLVTRDTAFGWEVHYEGREVSPGVFVLVGRRGAVPEGLWLPGVDGVAVDPLTGRGPDVN